MNATNYLETGFLNVMRNQAFTAPSKVYLGLFLTSPGETGTGTEISYDGYTRQEITFSVPSASGSTVSIQSQAQLTFPEANTAGGTAQHVGIFDSLSGGNCLAYGALSEGITIGEGESPVVLAGDVKLSLTGQLSTEYKTRLLNFFRGQTITGVSPYLALWNGNPESGGSEFSGGAYARVAVSFAAPQESESGQTVMQASSGVTFNRPESDWGNWTYTTLQDAQTSGNAIYIVQESVATNIKTGYRPTFDANNIRIALH